MLRVSPYSLSCFVARLNCLSIFQIKVSNKYTGDDFDEDLRTVLRRAGIKGKKICFIVDESNILESGFLERMNSLLANGSRRASPVLPSLPVLRVSHVALGSGRLYLYRYFAACDCDQCRHVTSVACSSVCGD